MSNKQWFEPFNTINKKTIWRFQFLFCFFWDLIQAVILQMVLLYSKQVSYRNNDNHNWL